MSRTEFVQQLKDMGYTVEELGGNRIAFLYEIQVGKFFGQTIRLGFEVGEDFPLTPPGGPHLSPRLLPINRNNGPHPAYGVHESPNFGGDWEYWSRPYPSPPGWGGTDKKVRTYMAHIANLFATQ